MKNIKLDTAEGRRDFMKTYGNGMYSGTAEDGTNMIVCVDKESGMDVKQLNSKGRYECIGYDKYGYREEEWVE